MARRNISLPDDLDRAARQARLNISAITQRAVVAELDRRRRMDALAAWLDDLDAAHGVPSPAARREAAEWFAAAIPAQSKAKRPKRKATAQRAVAS